MKQTSKTGLTASPIKKLQFTNRNTANKIQLKAIARPAPFILKRYSGLYNPYAGGCSLLCNHPMDKETKELLKKAKENWTNEGMRNVLLAEEIEAIRAGLSQYSFRERTPRHLISQVESVPEELFRRYTETDSRPLTPAPTLASAATRASGSRRCVTPEANTRHPKARLVLDLRRTHSQETISYSISLHEPPLIRIQQVPTRTASLEELRRGGPSSSRHIVPVPSPRKAKTAVTSSKINLSVIKTDKLEITDGIDKNSQDVIDNLNEEEEYIKRRGKKKKKKERDASRGPPAFQAPIDPETQVAAIGTDSRNQSARASLVPANNSQEAIDNASTSLATKSAYLLSHKSLDIDSYLDAEILKQLRRELNEEVVDSELNLKRSKALEEALKAVSKDKIECEELVTLQKELKIAPLNTELWISLPRTFSRSSARFELPMNGVSLSSLTPIDYVREHVSISSERKLLFNCIFNKFKREAELENEHERKLSGQTMQEALDLLMGRPMKVTEKTHFRNLLGWNDSDVFDFRTFCGIAALCERLMAPFYCPRLPDRKKDPCREIEKADFEILARKVNGHSIDERLIQILNDIKTS